MKRKYAAFSRKLGSRSYVPSGGRMRTETFRVSTSGQMSLPAAVRHRWNLAEGGQVDVIDLGFGVLTVPVGEARRLLDEILPADDHYAAVDADDDPDLATS